ncbi:12486_t:CDS:2 [Entrophospora sp. SA101]|nr:12486_t:CDS:2 [Entrophospora sp. SA101]
MLKRRKVSWKHIEGVYNYTSNHATAKATKLTKRHVWLTPWIKMRVDLSEQTLSKEVESVATHKLYKQEKEIITNKDEEYKNVKMIYLRPLFQPSTVKVANELLSTICKKPVFHISPYIFD